MIDVCSTNKCIRSFAGGEQTPAPAPAKLVKTPALRLRWSKTRSKTPQKTCLALVKTALNNVLLNLEPRVFFFGGGGGGVRVSGFIVECCQQYRHTILLFHDAFLGACPPFSRTTPRFLINSWRFLGLT